RRDGDAVDHFAVAAARQDADAPAEPRRGQRRIERRAAENGRAVRLDVGDDLADDDVFGRAQALHAFRLLAGRDRLTRIKLARAGATGRERRIARLAARAHAASLAALRGGLAGRRRGRFRSIVGPAVTHAAAP